jgi:hypothetical protein
MEDPRTFLIDGKLYYDVTYFSEYNFFIAYGFKNYLLNIPVEDFVKFDFDNRTVLVQRIETIMSLIMEEN